MNSAVISCGMVALFFTGGCYSPVNEITGKYEFRWTNAVARADPGGSRCERAGGIRSAVSEIEIVRDRDYAVVVHLGCKVGVTRRGSVLTTSGLEKCELVPGSQAEGLGFMNRYYDIRVDLSSGEVLISSTNLGENSGNTCLIADGHVRRPGMRLAKDSESRFWHYEGTGSAIADQYQSIWDPNGYIEERKDGTLFVQGFGCTLPGRTEAGETAAVPEGSCRTGVLVDYGAPQLVPLTYSFNESEFSMRGEIVGVDRNYTFEIQSTSVRPDDWDARHD